LSRHFGWENRTNTLTLCSDKSRLIFSPPLTPTHPHSPRLLLQARSHHHMPLGLSKASRMPVKQERRENQQAPPPHSPKSGRRRRDRRVGVGRTRGLDPRLDHQRLARPPQTANGNVVRWHTEDGVNARSGRTCSLRPLLRLPRPATDPHTPARYYQPSYREASRSSLLYLKHTTQREKGRAAVGDVGGVGWKRVGAGAVRAVSGDLGASPWIPKAGLVRDQTPGEGDFAGCLQPGRRRGR
jgi:hypothetical protein